MPKITAEFNDPTPFTTLNSNLTSSRLRCRQSPPDVPSNAYGVLADLFAGKDVRAEAEAQAEAAEKSFLELPPEVQQRPSSTPDKP